MKTVLILVLLFVSQRVVAQSNLSAIPPVGTPKVYTLLLKDGSVVSGQLIKRDSISLVVKKRNGRLTYVDLELFDRVIEDGAAPSASQATLPDSPTFAPLPAANDAKNYLILFKDGTQVKGHIVRRDSTTLVIQKRNGQLTYADPLLVQAVQDPAQVVPENSFAPFMTLNQTAHTADPGHLYYRNILLFYNELDYGISRNWSIGASVVPAAWFLSDLYVPSVSFSTKVSFPLGNLARFGVSGGYQPSRTYETFKQNEVWNLQALLSLGDSQRNITIGYGRSSSGNTPLNRQPYFTVSAMQRLSPGVTFITDNTLFTNQNWFFTGTAGLFSAAIRFERPRHTFDLGALGQTYIQGKNPQFFPYLAYNLRI